MSAEKREKFGKSHIVGPRRTRRPRMRWKNKAVRDLEEKGWKREKTLNKHLWKRRIHQSNANPTLTRKRLKLKRTLVYK